MATGVLLLTATAMGWAVFLAAEASCWVLPAYRDRGRQDGDPAIAHEILGRVGLPRDMRIEATGRTVVVNEILFYCFVGSHGSIRCGDFWMVGTLSFGFWLVASLTPTSVRPAHMEGRGESCSGSSA